MGCHRFKGIKEWNERILALERMGLLVVLEIAKKPTKIGKIAVPAIRSAAHLSRWAGAALTSQNMT